MIVGRPRPRLAARWPSAWRVFRDRHDTFRSAVVNEPRGSDVMVGAILLPPVDPACAAGRDLLQQRRLPRHVRPRHDRRRRCAGAPGTDRAGLASARNAGRHRHRHARRSQHASRSTTSRAIAWPRTSRSTCPGLRTYTGDVAWGGNWFFLVQDHGETLERRQRRTADRRDLADPPGLDGQDGITGPDGAEIDHIELFGPPNGRCRQQELRALPRARPTIAPPAAPARAPSSPAWSPTASSPRARSGGRRASSAACSRARCGSSEGRIRPRIRGTAYVNAESTLIVRSGRSLRAGHPA